jgi:hypothetical protein
MLRPAYVFFFFAQTTLLLTQNCFSRNTLPVLKELGKMHQMLVRVRKQNKIRDVQIIPECYALRKGGEGLDHAKFTLH